MNHETPRKHCWAQPEIKAPPSNLPICEVDHLHSFNEFQGPNHEGNENQRAKSYKDGQEKTPTKHINGPTHNEG